jgi:peptidoglycan/xylan/chitin deacetylase (PgdA/CDA1 family)
VRVILRRGVTAAALLAVCTLVLQISDSTTLTTNTEAATSPALMTQVPFGMAAGWDHEFYLTDTRVIPVGRRSISVPILMYHYIRPAPSIYTDLMGYRLSVTPANFTAQMHWLLLNGYHTVDFNDLRAYFAGRTPLPDKPIVITLDDGYRDLYTTAYPILKSFNFKAVAYIVSSFVGQSRYVTAAQVIEMDHYGIQIGAHTVDHANLARTSAYWATYQLTASKDWLQNLVGHPVVDFAYPSGKFNATVVSLLQATGYDTAVTEIGGTIHSRADRYTWTRVRVGGGESLSDFVQNLGSPEPSLDVRAVTTTQWGEITD